MGLTDAGERLKTRWQGFSTWQKVLFALAGICFLISLIFLGQWSNQTNMVPLFSELDTKDAAAVVEQLKILNIKYELTHQGSTIMVPEEDVYDLRLQIATSGVIQSGGIGFELFNQTNLGITDFERHLNFQRALQEELRRTIVQLDEVEQARVHLVLPEKNVFIEEETPATASVALKLKPLKKLSKEQVRGILLLVSSSVEGMQPENVTIIDMAGNVLSDHVAGDYAGDFTEQSLKRHEIKKAFENQMEQQLQTMLEKILGPGKAVTMINVDLDFDQREKHTVTYGNQVVRSEAGFTEETNLPTGATGVPGVESNVPEYPAESTENGQVTSEFSNREEYTRNYEVDTIEEKLVFTPGEIKKISAAVAVDGVLTSEKNVEIQNLVAAAIGLQPERGDQLTVTSMAFDKTYVEELDKEFQEYSQEQLANERKAEIKYWVMVGLGVLAVLVSLFVIFRMFVSAKTSSLDVAIDEPIPIKEIDDEPILSPEDITMKRKGEKAKKYTDEQPEETANILKTWLTFD